MSKRLYDERLETMDPLEVQYIDEIAYSRREEISPILRIERLERYRTIVLGQYYDLKAQGYNDATLIYKRRLFRIEIILEGLKFALQIDVLQCPL